MAATTVRPIRSASRPLGTSPVSGVWIPLLIGPALLTHAGLAAIAAAALAGGLLGVPLAAASRRSPAPSGSRARALGALRGLALSASIAAVLTTTLLAGSPWLSAIGLLALAPLAWLARGTRDAGALIGLACLALLAFGAGLLLAPAAGSTLLEPHWSRPAQWLPLAAAAGLFGSGAVLRPPAHTTLPRRQALSGAWAPLGLGVLAALGTSTLIAVAWESGELAPATPPNMGWLLVFPLLALAWAHRRSPQAHLSHALLTLGLTAAFALAPDLPTLWLSAGLPILGACSLALSSVDLRRGARGLALAVSLALIAVSWLAWPGLATVASGVVFASVIVLAVWTAGTAALVKAQP